MADVVRTLPVVKIWKIAEKVAKKLNVDTNDVYNLYDERFDCNGNLMRDFIPDDEWDLTNDYDTEIEECFRCIMKVANISWGDEFIAEFD
jgi:hypothetical protein